ncbi:MAG: radical SAM protein [Desulfatitalea sp.]|nr:radical SAM protein [Desulfatitalea sp.]NNK00126.1 radical SAM protein [Desulfatitalea sp.]
MPHILLVNPWIHDFAAYDVWAKPYGLLSLGAVLRAHGMRVSYIDCLDRFHPELPSTDPLSRHGRGPYLKRRLPNPKGLEQVQRTYSRYGILPQWLTLALDALEPPPDLILVTCLMTYWYPGAVETIGALKQRFPHVPVVLGGIYARLWTEHARRTSGANLVADDRGESLLDIVKRFTGHAAAPRFNLKQPETWPLPAFDLQRCMGYIPLLTCRGCPFDCAYCASRYLEPTMSRRSSEQVVAEIRHWHDRHGIMDFVFYDDALLVDANRHAIPLFEQLGRQGRRLRFHTPNALHIRAIDGPLARLMHHVGFQTLRLGLETSVFEARAALDDKVTEKDFVRAANHLKRAGFRADQIGAYLLVGLPGQRLAEVRHAIGYVKAAGITPVLAHFTPMPHTRLWEQACAASRYDLAADPIYSNNAIFPCSQDEFSWQTLSALKQLAQS